MKSLFKRHNINFQLLAWLSHTPLQRVALRWNKELNPAKRVKLKTGSYHKAVFVSLIMESG